MGNRSRRSSDASHRDRDCDPRDNPKRLGLARRLRRRGSFALVVAIDNTPVRFDEYTHVEDDIGNCLVGGHADAYADFVALGVVPFVDTRYPTRAARDARALLGSSLWSEPETLAYVHVRNGTHDEAAWAARLPGFLAALGDRWPAD